MKFRKKPIIIEATQWFKNGDHPRDYNVNHDGRGTVDSKEGLLVRYYNHPDIHCDDHCSECNEFMGDHGWIDTLEGGHVVCRGDWIITGIEGEHSPCKPEIFEKTYDIVQEVTNCIRYSIDKEKVNA